MVFSDETLDNLMDHDRQSYEAITREFSYWGEIDFNFRGDVVRSTGHGFCGTERRSLLAVLQDRCRELGVKLEFSTEISDLTQFGDADLIVAADGISSFIREKYKEHFQPKVELRRNHFIWLGSTAPSPAFSFHFAENEFGIWDLCTYQYKRDMSTWVVEAPDATWAKAESTLAKLDEDQTVAYLEKLFSKQLRGHKLIANRSFWRRFPVIQNANWYYKNIVLLGDALHTAHFSIGSGTKLAMEDAITLFDSFEKSGSVAGALKTFQGSRREEVEKTQYAANVSALWTENPARYWGMSPIQACFSMLSRAKAVTYENLRLRDPKFVDEVQAWFAGTVRAQGFDVATDNPPPPMFTPFRIGQMVVENRVAVSPMNMYSAEPGAIPGEFHLRPSRPSGDGWSRPVFAEMTAVSEQGRITPGCPGIYNDAHVAAWRRISNFVHRESKAKLCLQLGHCGRKGSTKRGWEGMERPLDEDNWETFAASPLAFYDYMHLPREMTRADMERVIADYAQAAVNTDKADFDMVELHAGHGYLLSGFISPLSNQRRRIRRQFREPPALSPRSVRRRARQLAPAQTHLGAHLGDRLGAGRHHPGRRPARCGRLPLPWRRYYRCVGGPNLEVGQSGLWPHVPDTILRNDPQRGRHSNHRGWQHHDRGSGQHHRRGRPGRHLRHRAVASDQSPFHVDGFGRVWLWGAGLAIALSGGQGPSLPARATRPGGHGGAPACGAAVRSRSAP